MKEGAVFHFFEDLGRQCPPATVKRRPERPELSGRDFPAFGTIDGGPKIQGIRADAAGLCPKPRRWDLRSGVGIGIFKRLPCITFRAQGIHEWVRGKNRGQKKK